MGLALLLGACASDAEQKNQDKKEASESQAVVQTPKGPICDPALTGFARFIACMDLDSGLLEKAEPNFQSKLRDVFGIGFCELQHQGESSSKGEECCRKFF